MKLFNIIGLLIAFAFYFTNKTLEGIWIIVLLIYTNQKK